MRAVEVAPRDLGTLLHEVLAEYADEVRVNGELSEQWLRDKLVSVPPEQVEAVLMTLWPFMLRIAPELRAAENVACEVELAAYMICDEWFACRYDDPRALLRGKADRIDWMGQGVVEVTDYKTGWGGHDTLQGLIYALLVFVNNPDVRLVRVQFANPLHNYLSDAYEIERFDCLERANQLVRTCSVLAPKYGPLSYSALARYYRCPASLDYYKDKEPAEGVTYRPGPHCSLCDGVARCQHRDPDAPTNKNEAKKLFVTLLGLKARVDHITELLKVYCTTNGLVGYQGKYCGFQYSTPKPTVDVREFSAWLQAKADATDPRLPSSSLDKFLTLRQSKTVLEALSAFELDGGKVVQKNAPLRFMFGSEKEERHDN